MAYKHDDKSSGQLVRSADWNTMGHAIEDLDTAKVNRAGDTIRGPLTVTGLISGAEARFSSILRVGGALSTQGGLDVSGPASLQADLNVGGDLTVRQIVASGGIQAGNSDIYFTNTAHNHTGIGNADGFAAIENAQNFNALMILGRSRGAGGQRVVGLWDRLELHGNLAIDGNIQSPRFQVTELLRFRPGALPISVGFSTNFGTVVIFVSGSGFSGVARQIGMDIQVDGSSHGPSMGFTNEISSHKPFTPRAVVIAGLGAGVHTLSLVPLAGTVTDFNDFFNATVLELPF